ncbi:xanthine dehydrogenase subunit XdhC [Enterococcus sp. CSURQ0835]|uniref:xanthine dehydrogenase subunit XdhC n=1 Tax=Enterococcus sp. CSURQ0835 TaxID=2681394 RepID=UPI0013599AAE|nr:xanthine dehydrogenase subunit XdhC [Enterococcus sp. CSURQ0835]
MKQEITFTLNNEEVTVLVDVRKSLLEMLREEFALMGTKEGCGVGECGACTVIVDDQTVDSCIYLAMWVAGRKVTTIEGITQADGTLADIQAAYVEAGAVQCGFCIPGMVLSSENLLQHNPQPSRAEIRRGLSGNMCRCTGYQKIVDAVEVTAHRRNEQ